MGSNQATSHQTEPQTAPGWTTVGELRLRLTKRWTRGKPLADHAAGRWKPISIKLKGPSAEDLAERPADVEVWAMGLDLASVGEFESDLYRIETGRVTGQAADDDREVPVRIWFDTIDRLAGFVGGIGELSDLDWARSVTQDRLPALSDWVRDNPKKVVASALIWEQLVGVVRWISDHEPSLHYLREIDVPEANLGFVHKHRRILDSMLSEILPPERIDRSIPVAEFGRRFRFREAPSLIRMRTNGGVRGWPPGLSEMTIPLTDLAGLGLRATSVFLMENPDCFLSFPLPPGGIAVRGWWFDEADLEMLVALGDGRLFFWGDVDAKGYMILDLLRSRTDSVEPILMGEDTLDLHRSSVVDEKVIYRSQVSNLRPDEVWMYYLVTGEDGNRPMRLPQEEISFDWVKWEVASLDLAEAIPDAPSCSRGRVRPGCHR